jgi:hypothetical protein
MLETFSCAQDWIKYPVRLRVELQTLYCTAFHILQGTLQVHTLRQY